MPTRPPAISSKKNLVAYFLTLQAVQNLLQAETNVFGVNVPAIGQRTAESISTGQTSHHETKAECILQTNPHLLDQKVEIRMMECEEDDNDKDNVIAELIEVTEYSEIGNNNTLTEVNVKGSLLRHIEFWKRIGTPKDILSVITEGYCSPFTQLPPRKSLNNNKSALGHPEFV